jgi:hypothetical protein
MLTEGIMPKGMRRLWTDLTRKNCTQDRYAGRGWQTGRGADGRREYSERTRMQRDVSAHDMLERLRNAMDNYHKP